MRTDVKVGIALGAIVLVIAVSYYGTKGGGDIELADSAKQVEQQNTKVLDQFLGSPQETAKPAARTPARGTPSAQRRPATPRNTPAPAPQRIKPAQRKPGAPQVALNRPPIVTAPPADAAARRSAPPSSVQNRPGIQAPATTPPTPRTRSGAPDDRSARAPGASGSNPSDRPQQPRRGTSAARPPGTRTHEIQSGDNFAVLAEQYYGSQSHAAFLAKANPTVDPRRMKIGARIDIPPLSKTATSDTGTPKPAAPTARPLNLDKNQYQVQPGDTFYRIAESKLGSGGRWREIYELNKKAVEDPDMLKIGQVLQLPAG